MLIYLHLIYYGLMIHFVMDDKPASIWYFNQHIHQLCDTKASQMSSHCGLQRCCSTTQECSEKFPAGQSSVLIVNTAINSKVIFACTRIDSVSSCRTVTHADCASIYIPLYSQRVGYARCMRLICRMHSSDMTYNTCVRYPLYIRKLCPIHASYIIYECVRYAVYMRQMCSIHACDVLYTWVRYDVYMCQICSIHGVYLAGRQPCKKKC